VAHENRAALLGQHHLVHVRDVLVEGDGGALGSGGERRVAGQVDGARERVVLEQRLYGASEGRAILERAVDEDKVVDLGRGDCDAEQQGNERSHRAEGGHGHGGARRHETRAATSTEDERASERGGSERREAARKRRGRAARHRALGA